MKKKLKENLFYDYDKNAFLDDEGKIRAHYHERGCVRGINDVVPDCACEWCILREKFRE